LKTAKIFGFSSFLAPSGGQPPEPPLRPNGHSSLPRPTACRRSRRSGQTAIRVYPVKLYKSLYPVQRPSQPSCPTSKLRPRFGLRLADQTPYEPLFGALRAVVFFAYEVRIVKNHGAKSGAIKFHFGGAGIL